LVVGGWSLVVGRWSLVVGRAMQAPGFVLLALRKNRAGHLEWRRPARK
jgi:hypothetical protein